MPRPTRPRPRIRNPRYPVWTEHKARLIERYLYYFVMVTKGGVYADGFAGAQDPSKPHTWAAKLVLESEPRWLTEFHLFESDPRQLAGLEALRSGQPPRNRQKREPKRAVTIYSGDFNDTVLRVLQSGAIKKTRATFCLLDQRTFECRWSTLQALANYKTSGHKIELFYFLPNSWLDRALAATTKDTAIIDAWWGRKDWRALRGMRSVERSLLFANRFERELGYWAARPWAIYARPTGGPVMYYMIHATDHPAAPGLMSRAYHRVVQPRETPEQFMLDLGLKPPPQTLPS